MRFPVQMRAVPTVTVGGASNPRIYDGTQATAVTSVGGNNCTIWGAALQLNATGGGLTVGRAAIIIDNSNSFITYSAEL